MIPPAYYLIDFHLHLPMSEDSQDALLTLQRVPAHTGGCALPASKSPPRSPVSQPRIVRRLSYGALLAYLPTAPQPCLLFLADQLLDSMHIFLWRPRPGPLRQKPAEGEVKTQKPGHRAGWTRYRLGRYPSRRSARRSIPARGGMHGSAKPLARVTLAKVSEEQHADHLPGTLCPSGVASLPPTPRSHPRRGCV